VRRNRQDSCARELFDVVLQVGAGRLVFAGDLFGPALLFQAFVADELASDFLRTRSVRERTDRLLSA